MSYSKLFRSTIAAGQQLFGVKLFIGAMVSDHSSPAQNAARSTWLQVQMILCWPHLFREARPARNIVRLSSGVRRHHDRWPSTRSVI